MEKNGLIKLTRDELLLFRQNGEVPDRLKSTYGEMTPEDLRDIIGAREYELLD